MIQLPVARSFSSSLACRSSTHLAIPLTARKPFPQFAAPHSPLGQNRRIATTPLQATNGTTPNGNGNNHDDDEQEEFDTFSTMAGTVDIVDRDEADIDVFGESTIGNYHFVTETIPETKAVDLLGLPHLRDILQVPYDELKSKAQNILTSLNISPSTYPYSQPQRAIYCSRTLNLRSIQAIGYDMDYTLVHYDVDAWEGRAYDYGMKVLGEMGCPVQGLKFDSDLVIRGLVIDTELGNIVKADRFGFIKRAMHGGRMLSPAEVRNAYSRELINLKDEKRYVFLNTLFSVSEAVMYAQMVDRLDQGAVPQKVNARWNYQGMYKLVSRALFMAHVEGKLKAEIIQEPAKFVELDPDMAQTLLDQRAGGKELVLITNSDWHYTDSIMSFAYNQFMPDGQTWRDLFDLVIVNARKPDFFKSTQSVYEIVTDDGLLRPAMEYKKGRIFCGGSAKLVEKCLNMSNEDIMYVGDHLYTDAAMAKLEFKWRTCLIVRELEREVEALTMGREHREMLRVALNKKDQVGDAFNCLRLARQRLLQGKEMQSKGADTVPEHWDEHALNEALAELLNVMEKLDQVIAPAIECDGEHFNKYWGYLSRAGVNDRSQLMRQLEKYSDVYTSRVSNFLRYTPYMYFRSPAMSIAHDRPTSDQLVLNVIDSDGSSDKIHTKRHGRPHGHPGSGSSGSSGSFSESENEAAGRRTINGTSASGNGSNGTHKATAM